MAPFPQGKQITYTEICGKRFIYDLTLTTGGQWITSLTSAAAGSDSVGSPNGLLLLTLLAASIVICWGAVHRAITIGLWDWEETMAI